MIEQLSAVTLATGDMGRAVRFYQALGVQLLHGAENADFASFRIGPCYLNLALRPGYKPGAPWGRVIFYVSDVDQLYNRALAQGLQPSTRPRDAEWQERYFHISDPDGHELSFARPLASR